MVQIKRLNIFIDESGDFGIANGSSNLYAVSFVLHESNHSIREELAYLNQKLERLNYVGMIHTADLIGKKEDYSYLDLAKRRSIFWALFYFSTKVKIKVHTILVDKAFLNKRAQLKSFLAQKMENLLLSQKKYLSSFDKIVVYYDNGQKVLANLIDTLFSTIPNLERQIHFNHSEKRLFQVADMLTVIDKLEYKRRKKIPLTKAELYFFEVQDLKHIIDLLKKKRI